MQGTFERPAGLPAHEGAAGLPAHEGSAGLPAHEGAAGLPVQAGQGRLDAIANVPWRNLQPANDKDTQRRMERHSAMERIYQSSSNNQRQFMPKVAPYPETPDGVFPGCPCYKVVVDGVSRFVFVVDPASPDYPAGWDGGCRPQSSARWVVPHFIFREEASVAQAKSRYTAVYEIDAQAGNPPPEKSNFDSRVIPLVGGALPPQYGVAAQYDSYYVYGEPNADATAPEISDPLFDSKFNRRVRAGVPLPGGRAPPVRVRPWPYKQPSTFPRQPPPPALFQMVPAPPPAPAGAPPVQQQLVPNAALLEVLRPTNTGRGGVDWIPVDPGNFEVSSAVLKDVVQQAEEKDHDFALSIQGLRGTNLSAVWACSDPEYDITDRAAVLSQFVRAYMERFYGQVSAGGADVEEVVHEALRMHEEFCKGWVATHHRTLSAEVTAAAEALVGHFFDALRPYLPAGLGLTRRHLACYFRRHSTYSGEFAQCLYHFMTSMDHSRGNRNPSYKAMSKEQNLFITAMKDMSELLHSNLPLIQQDFARLGPSSLVFDLHFVDWHYIAAQMPQHHKDFDGYANNFNLYRSRAGGRANAFPPWQQMRMR